ncbi:MAG: 30S ribosomal protein S2 [Chloroflexota bacterium]
MPNVSMRQLLEAGIHFGHQTRRWNPKMKRYIFAERNGIHIIDLAKTVKGLEEALEFVRQTVAQGDTVLFVGTKKQAQEPISEEATRSEMPYVNQRWLGGMLTNFVTIRKRVGLLDQLEARQQNGEFERITKKEASVLTEEMNKLQRTLGGIRKMRRLPGAMFVIDPQREHIAVTEARKLEIPVIGTGDTNVDPDMLDYVIPANDDAIRAIRLLCSLIADAAAEGGRERAARPVDEPVAAIEEQEEASEEMIAALAAGGTFSFEPEPEEEELLPADRAVAAEEPEEEAEPAVARAAAARPAPRAAARPGAPKTGAARKPALAKDKDRDKSSAKEDEEAAS